MHTSMALLQCINVAIASCQAAIIEAFRFVMLVYSQAQLRGLDGSTDSQFLHPKCTGQSPRRNCFADTICPPVTKVGDRSGRNFKMVMKRAFKTTCSYSSCLHESAVLNESSNLRPVMSAVQICRRGWTDDVRRSHQKQRTPRICELPFSCSWLVLFQEEETR